jgi:hypothetical protein
MLEEFADADEGVHSDGLVTTLSNFFFFIHDAAKKLVFSNWYNIASLACQRQTCKLATIYQSQTL